MYRQLARLTPVVKTRVQFPACRSLFDWGPRRMDPIPDVKSLMRQMERQMERFDREFDNIFHRFPVLSAGLQSPSNLAIGAPRANTSLPIQASDNTYRLNLDMSGFRPEDVKVSLKDNVLTVEAKSEVKGEDGSRLYQEVSRKYALPEGLDTNAVKSVMSPDGILTIEGPLPESEKPKEIPINKVESIEAPESEKK